MASDWIIMMHCSSRRAASVRFAIRHRLAGWHYMSITAMRQGESVVFSARIATEGLEDFEIIPHGAQQPQNICKTIRSRPLPKSFSYRPHHIFRDITRHNATIVPSNFSPPLLLSLTCDDYPLGALCVKQSAPLFYPHGEACDAL